MRTTPFAGLTELEPGEPLSTDGGSFTARNPSIIDHYLEIGARSHRHNGAPALGDPGAAPILTTSSAGGTLPADTVFALTYTLVDERGGETLSAPIATVTTPAPLDEPFEAPQIALELDQGGTLTAGTYYYAASFVDDAGGETPIGPAVEVVREPGAASARVRLTGLADLIADAGALRYRLYRAKGQETFALLADDVVDEVLDDGSIALDCGVHPQDENTTNSTNSLSVTVPVLPAEAAAFRVFLGVDGDFTSPSLFGPARLPAEAGAPIVVAGVDVDEGAPPDVATTVAGASKIDASTEIENLRWQPPVADEASLPAAAGNTIGDARVALAEMTLWGWDGATWRALGGAGGGGGGGSYVTVEDGTPPDPTLDALGPGWGSGVATEARWVLRREVRMGPDMIEHFDPGDPETIDARFQGGNLYEQVAGQDRIRPLDANGAPVALVARDVPGGAGTRLFPAGVGVSVYSVAVFVTDDWSSVGLGSGRLRVTLDRLAGTLTVSDTTGDAAPLVLGAADGVIVPGPGETLYLDFYRHYDHVKLYFEVEDAAADSLGVLEPVFDIPAALRPLWWSAVDWSVEFRATWADNVAGAFELDYLSAEEWYVVRTLALHELHDETHVLYEHRVRELGAIGRGFHVPVVLDVDPAWTFSADEQPFAHESDGWVRISGAVTPPDANATTLLATPIPKVMLPPAGSFVPQGTRVYTVLDLAGTLQRISVDLATGVVTRDTTGTDAIPLHGIAWPI